MPLPPRTLDTASEADQMLVHVARNSEPLLRHDTDDYGSALYPVGDDDDPYGAPLVGYLIWWTDYVANEWAEFFPTLPVALTRFGALIDAAQREAFYTGTVLDFSEDVRDLFDTYAT